VKVALFVVALNLTLNLVLTRYIAHVGIALGTSVASWANVLVLGALLMHRKQLVLDRRLRRTVPRLALAGLVMVAVLFALEAALFPLSSGWARLAALALLVSVGMAAYFGAAHLLGALDLRQAVRMLRRSNGGRAT
jgi:putative peptidoglycan lipid II flippase